MTTDSKPDTRTMKAFLIELVVYATLVFAYFLVVLHFLGDQIKHLYDYDRRIYAVVALSLIVGQGVGLEMLTTWLLRFIHGKTR